MSSQDTSETIAPLLASQIRRARDRGALENDWLQARFSFSFANYQDPNHVSWGPLRALNDDLVAAGRGFGPHGHRDIETITYPIRGTIRHTDNLGNDYVFGRGQIQRMSAGTGVIHSEMNASAQEAERHLQIWLYPSRPGLPPSCELVDIDESSLENRWRPIASPDGREGSATVQQEALVYASRLSPGSRIEYALRPERLGYLHVVDGALLANEELQLQAGDGLRIDHGQQLSIAASPSGAEVLLFDL